MIIDQIPAKHSKTSRKVSYHRKRRRIFSTCREYREGTRRQRSCSAMNGHAVSSPPRLFLNYRRIKLEIKK